MDGMIGRESLVLNKLSDLGLSDDLERLLEPYKRQYHLGIGSKQ